MLGHRSLGFPHFVDPGPRRSRLPVVRGLAVSLAAVLLLGGCQPRDTAPSVEDSETSGRISIAAAPDVRAMVAVQADSFRTLYPQAVLELREPESSSAVIAALLGGHADVAAAARELETEEREMARQGGIAVEGHRIAQDAMVLVVASANPVRNLTVEDLANIWRGDLTDWSAVGGRSARIVPVLPPLSSDLARAFVQRVLPGEVMRAASMLEASDSAVAARVAAIPGAIGLVSLPLATSPGVRALALAPLAGTPYVEPDMQTVHEGTYPLTRFVNLYIRAQGARLAGGFVTYASSEPGQRLVLAHGRVPTAVPIRFVHRSPLLGSH